MDIKNIEQLTTTALNLLYDLNSHKSKNNVIELLQSEVFSQIQKESFTIICNHLKSNISNHPESEIMVFEEALEIFLRELFELGEKNEQK